MSRPLYETRVDRLREQAVAERLGATLDCTAHKLGMRYVLDFALLGRTGKVRYFCEVKWRELPFGYGDGFYVALGKVLAAESLLAATGIASLVAVRCIGNSVHVGFMRGVRPGHVILHGRTDRNDPADIEPHMVLPWRMFEFIGDVVDPVPGEVAA
jgi:hypothetical protein